MVPRKNDNFVFTFCSLSHRGESRTQHPAELLGDDWLEHGDWGIEADSSGKSVTP